ncbi:hypothetical protein [Trinickia mobilis]|uniref:hypothetical protein n=1 Tax=Trinickia mobilis TaxID=2816356 RepID=UPI001A8CADC3|nr:hypothetical protein [Trinickia mobilis]
MSKNSKVSALHGHKPASVSVRQLAQEYAAMPTADLMAELVELVEREKAREIEQGRILTQIRDERIYERKGYKSVYALASAELGVSTAEVKRLMTRYANSL